MCHERGMLQPDIADTLHRSQARVSRLKRAAEFGVVRTVGAVKPIHAAFVGGWINVLFTDTGTATALLRLGSSTATPAIQGHGGG
jgi:DNA-binding transcriptional regulator LsrR (DeoR family)